ncbi:hypothetical protein [Phenylobacterium sp.]|jgi:hypothetical protein|uniref:hypothetical protein n=1 Tax=Phenylobacterium sp. TaxID=1871053 RepID=UPI002F95A995
MPAMGFSISWLAFEGLTKADALGRLSLTDTGHPDEANEAPFSAADLPTGWALVFSNDFDFASDARLAQLSAGATLLAGQVEEHVMYSSARLFRDGACVWRIQHDAGCGLAHLDAEGRLPETFAAARDAALRELDEAGGEASEVDFLFDVPVEVAADACGWRYDQDEFEWGQAEFTVAADPGATGSVAALMARLFGRRR